MHRCSSGALASTSGGSSGGRQAASRAPHRALQRQRRRCPAARPSAAARMPMFTAAPEPLAPTATPPAPAALLQQQLDSARAGLSQLAPPQLGDLALPQIELAPPSEADLQAGGAAALQLAQGAAGAVGEGLRAAAAPFAVFDAGWGINLLFCSVLILFIYNLLVLAPRL